MNLDKVIKRQKQKEVNYNNKRKCYNCKYIKKSVYYQTYCMFHRYDLSNFKVKFGVCSQFEKERNENK